MRCDLRELTIRSHAPIWHLECRLAQRNLPNAIGQPIRFEVIH